MTVDFQVINVQKSTGGNGTTQDVNLNFTPKAIILYCTGGTSDNASTANYHNIQGFSDGTNHACVASASEDAALVSDTGRIQRNDSVFVRLSETAPSTTALCRGTCVFATNKVTFTWVTNDAVATRFVLFAIGGSDITNVKVNTVDSGRNTAGTQNYTGLGFNPVAPNGAVFIITSGLTTTNTHSTVCQLGSGCGITTSKRFVLNTLSEHAADPSDTWRYHSNTNIVETMTAAGASESIADFNGWITDGFQLNWTDPPSSTAQKLSYLVINGGTWDCGNFATPANSTQNSDTTVSVSSNTLRGVILASILLDSASLNAIQTQNTFGLGAADYNINQGSASCVEQDALATMDTWRIHSTTLCLTNISINGNIVIQATFDSFPDNSTFRIDYAAASATSQVSWVVVADSVAVEVFPHSYGKINTMFDNNSGPAIFG